MKLSLPRFPCRKPAVLASVFVAVGFGVTLPAQLVTWVLPSGKTESGLEMTSVAPDAEMELANRKGEPIDSVGDMGWTYTEDEYGKVLRSGRGRHPDGELYGGWQEWGAGGAVRVTVRNLPPGQHEVFVHYWAEAPRDQNWYVLKAGLDEDLRFFLTHDKGEIVRGLGGYEGAIYEKSLGVVGSDDSPATEVEAYFKRSRHGFVARFGGFRIESKLDADVPRTAPEILGEEEKKVRERLMATVSGLPGEAERFGMGVVPATLKVRPKSFESLVGTEPQGGFDLAGARAEWVNAQVVFFSPERDFEVAALETDGLAHEGGDFRIPSENLLFAPVGYLFYDRSFDLQKHGWWPGPILDFLTGGFTIGRGDVQSLWFRVRVPREAPPGLYAGEATIRGSDGTGVRIPVRLRVYDFEMPRAFSLRTAMSTTFVEHAAGNGEDFVLSYGLNPSGIYSSSSPSKEDLMRWGRDGRVTAFNVRYLTDGYIEGLGTGDPDEAELEKVLDQVARCLDDAEDAGIRDAAYFYMFDEAKRQAIPEMRAFSKALHERFPDLLQLTTSQVFGGHGNTEELPYLRGWTPRVPKYRAEEAAEARRDHGREVWYYTANTPRPPYPNFRATQTAMAHRLLMGFMAYGYRTDGFLYWRTDKDWHRSNKRITDGPYIPPEVWPLRQHGQFIPRGPDGPIPGIRLEMIRDGLEDFEYLQQADAALERIDEKALDGEQRKTVENIRSLLRPGNSVFVDFGDFTKDPRKLEGIRRYVGEFIEEISGDEP